MYMIFTYLNLSFLSILQFSGIYIFAFSIIILGVIIYGMKQTWEAPAHSRYNIFRNENEPVSVLPPEGEETSPLPADDTDLTEEERERMHKDFNNHLNGTNWG